MLKVMPQEVAPDFKVIWPNAYMDGSLMATYKAFLCITAIMYMIMFTYRSLV